MYEDLVGKKEELKLKVTKNEDIKYNIEITNSYMNNELDTINLDPSMSKFSINKAVILPRTFEFYDPIDEVDLVAIPREKLESLIDRVDDAENLENEIIYYKHICSNLQKQLTQIEMENIVGKSAQLIVVDDLPKNETYWHRGSSVWNDFIPKELEIKFHLQELQLFDGDISWLMVVCEDWEPDFKYTSWTGIERDLQEIDFKSMYETDPFPNDKSQARFFGEPSFPSPKLQTQAWWSPPREF